MKIFRTFGLSLFPFAALLLGCNAQPKASVFSEQIEACRAMEGVTSIVEGRLQKPIKSTNKFDSIGEALDRDKKGKAVYSLKVSHLHLGRSGITDNRTGKQIPPASIIIREGEAPRGALGKKALLCYGGDPRKIMATYLQG